MFSTTSIPFRPPTSPPLVTTDIISASAFGSNRNRNGNGNDDNDKIAILRMNRKPANALSMEMCNELSNALRTITESVNNGIDNTAVSAIIISSSIPNIFSAGIDIQKELYQPDDINRLSQFWFSFQQLFLDLYGLNHGNGNGISTIAAVNGHAPAGGCMIALSCDYRIMLNNPKLRIGYNESKLGITAPSWMSQQYIDFIGSRHKAELSLLLGKLYSPQEAFTIGLVDELLDENDDIVSQEENEYDDDDDDNNNNNNNISLNVVEKVAIEKAKEFIQIPTIAQQNVKKWIRQPLIDLLVQERQKDNDEFCDFVTSPKVQKYIKHYLHSLQSKSKSKV